MLFEINPQREEYLKARGKTVLNACPGSGKTTCIVYKLALLQKECLEKYGPHAGIACLSFTNRAKDEIQGKYKKVHGEHLKYPHVVSTIDSFINHFITLPFYNIINKEFKRPKIIDDDKIINASLRIYFKDKKTGKPREWIQKPFDSFKDKSGRALFLTYPASDIWVELDGTFSFKGKFPGEALVDKKVFYEYGKAIFQWKAKKGLITSLDSAFAAKYILDKSEKIGKWLASRFPYIIIDESQDNSAIQHVIFDKLSALGLANIELIGDPYQSLYEWRDAKPQLFVEKFGLADWKGLPLSHNRRSNQRIIDCFSILRLPGDEQITSTGVTDLNIPITIYKYNDTNPPIIIKDFESKCTQKNFTKNQIVVRGNDLKDKMLGKIGSIEPWKTSLPGMILGIKHLFETQNIKDAVNSFRNIVLKLSNTGKDYHELKDIEKDSKGDNSLNGKIYLLLSKIPATNLALDIWSDECIKLLKEFNENISTFFEFKIKINGFKMADLKKESVNKYFNKSASLGINIPISTIHQIKGATLDAILCFFNENSLGQNISFNDFKAPAGFPSEKQRMIYVACSRPSQFLAMAFPEKIPDAELKKKFGDKVDILIL